MDSGGAIVREADLRLEHLLSIFTASPGDALLVTDTDGRITALNPAAEQLLRRARADVIQMSFADIVRPEAPTSDDVDKLSLVHLNGTAWRPATARLDAKRSIHIQFAGAPFYDQAGALAGQLMLLRPGDEVTPETARDSGAIDRMAQLAGGLAHDFNNVLTVITGNIQMADERTRDSRLKAFLREALLACATGARMTERLKLFAQKKHLHAVALQANDIISSLAPAFAKPLSGRIELTLDLADPLPCIRVDRSEFENALLNILINAADAMRGRGQLTIRTEVCTGDADNSAGSSSRRFVSITITDTGAGMAPHVAARAFEPYFTTKSWKQGTGLGLATVRGFVNQSGGSISLDSAVGVGTRIIIHLPALPDDGCA
jgi:signal transduction histidine kinase